jgi:hypothetical protein
VTFKINDLMVDVLATEMSEKDKGCGACTNCTKCTKCTAKTGPVSGCTDTNAIQDCCSTRAGYIAVDDIEMLRAQMRAALEVQAA